MGCVYLITNLVNGKYYVGKTEKTAQQRWADHCARAAGGSAYKFHRAIRKYGKEAFEIQILVEACEPALDSLEQLWIAVLSAICCGYNMTMGGDGGRQSPEVRAKLGQLVLGNKRGRANKGKCRTEEQKLRIGKARCGKPAHNKGIVGVVKMSEATRLKMCVGQKARREREAAL